MNYSDYLDMAEEDSRKFQKLVRVTREINIKKINYKIGKKNSDEKYNIVIRLQVFFRILKMNKFCIF